MLFTDQNGRVIKRAEIMERGNGSITVYAYNLSEGIYTYTLIADGKVVESKSMVCTK